MIDGDTLKALVIVAALYFGARWFMADHLPKSKDIKGGRK